MLSREYRDVSPRLLVRDNLIHEYLVVTPAFLVSDNLLHEYLVVSPVLLVGGVGHLLAALALGQCWGWSTVLEHQSADGC